MHDVAVQLGSRPVFSYLSLVFLNLKEAAAAISKQEDRAVHRYVVYQHL